MKRYLLFFLVSLITVTCAEKENQIAYILRLENQRVSCDSLKLFLNSPEPKYRARAVEALGKLQDTSCLPDIIKMLKDPDHKVRLETAFALGQLGNSEAEAALIEQLNQSEESSEVKIRIVEALGKVGTKRSFPILIRLFKAENAKLRAEAALSVGRMALRNLTNPSVTNALKLLLKDSDQEVRWKASYSLMRIGKDLDAASLRKAVQDPDPRVRMYAVQALGKLNDVAILETFGRILKNDPDWLVRVKVANAFGYYPLRQVANYFFLLNQNTHVRRAILQTIGTCALQEPDGFQQNSREHNLAKYQLEQVLTFQPESDEEKEIWTPAEIGAALISYAQLMGEKGIELISQFTDHANPRIRARAMAALGETRSPKVMRIFETSYANAPTIEKIAILEGYARVDKRTNPQLFLNALKENDQVLVALAAKGLSQDSLNSKIYAQPILQAYQKLPKPVDVESAQMIFRAMGKIGDKRVVPVLEEALQTPDKALSRAAAEALTKITAEDYSDRITPYTLPHSDFRYKEILNLKSAKAFIKTNRGNIEIELFTADAPLTVLNFVQLAEKGFYDRLTFHRVVPNFVIQGGDPRGDSWGSPGYAIRSEFNKRPYLRGTVGMASAGKDTEGCQFFITHSEQPHLDGRYTVFGQVTSGMDVVDAIQEGDVMELVTISK
ncbi:MAG: HEAT repeat domain-containing protein [bacterium]